ncbi:hypothetical protein TIFTF001_020877 [Ficus carica]|uniref:Uncharacterized protein n=1 Tax=Ficus carica TaxID=3494 RepID=A0AA88DA83_FICCA|nr:hypothetical protein TIFTF001_020877 [Ficus carica]
MDLKSINQRNKPAVAFSSPSIVPIAISFCCPDRDPVLSPSRSRHSRDDNATLEAKKRDLDSCGCHGPVGIAHLLAILSDKRVR